MPTKNNKSIPKDLSITGFDDSMIAEEIWPSLTTVRQPVEAMAKHAIECIISKIDPMSHKVPFSKVFSAEIITRESLIKKT
jgi:LacI family transcriptional regulator